MIHSDNNYFSSVSCKRYLIAFAEEQVDGGSGALTGTGNQLVSVNSSNTLSAASQPQQTQSQISGGSILDQLLPAKQNGSSKTQLMNH